MEGNAFLFRIPNSSTRNRVLSQRLWQIEGQTLFVAKWEPGLLPAKPELKSAPIWLELINVPFQFFNDEGLEHIASLVGEPKQLHQSTAMKTNLDVAKVLTLMDPRVPLPEAVNVQFESGTICRIEVSSPWMPPVCGFCRDIGHTQKRCSKAPSTCTGCGSTIHTLDKCPREGKGQSRQRKHALKSRREVIPEYEWKQIEKNQETLKSSEAENPEEVKSVEQATQENQISKGDYKGKGHANKETRKSTRKENTKLLSLATTSTNTGIHSDTSHDSSSDQEKEYTSEEEARGYKQVLPRRRHKQMRGDRGVSLKIA